MTTIAPDIELKQSFVANVNDDGPKPLQWSLADFFELSEQGFFNNKKVELVQGRIYDMPEQLFVRIMLNVYQFIIKCFGEDAWVRYQLPILIPDRDSYVEPDVSAVAGTIQDYSDHPTEALFVAEVSISSVTYDKNEKAPLYASMGVPEYWLVNVPRKVIEVYSDPVVDEESKTGYGYDQQVDYTLNDSISLQSYPDKKTTVADLFR
jgi:Uma2 family endonuclease